MIPHDDIIRLIILYLGIPNMLAGSLNFAAVEAMI